MPQFDADSIVEPLEYTFAYRVGETAIPGPSGVISEPSDKQIGAFLAGLKRVSREAQDKLGLEEAVDVTDPEQLLRLLDGLDPEEFVTVADEMASLYADLCSGAPDKAAILTLPTRRRNLFYQWLLKEAIAPEVAPGGGNGQANHLPLSAVG